MQYHRVLEKQIRKHLSGELQNDPGIVSFLQEISAYYTGKDRDQKLSDQAFAVSEREYQDAIVDLSEKNDILQNAIAQLKEAIATLKPEILDARYVGGDDISKIISFLTTLIVESKELEKQIRENVTYLEKLNRVNFMLHNISYERQVESIYSEILDALPEIFQCQTAWISKPGAADDASVTIAAHAGQPQADSASETNTSVMMTDELRSVVRRVQSERECIIRDLRSVPNAGSVDGTTNTALCMGLPSANGKAWLLVLAKNHSQEGWSGNDRKLFSQIAVKYALKLNTLLLTEELRISETKYKSMLETTDDIVVSYNFDGHITYMNHKGLEYMGLTRENYADRNILEFIPEEHRKKVVQLLEDRAKGLGGARLIELEIFDKAGERFPFEVNSSTTETGDGKGNVLAFVRNVAERKNHENTLIKQNSELKKINQELDRFVYSTSHDLRAPLTSVLGLVNISKDTVEKGSDIYEYLEMMEVSVMNLDNVIKSILEYSKSNRMEVKYEPTNMKIIYDSVLDSLNYMRQSKEISHYSTFLSDGDFISDKVRVSSIIRNLITNAIKYSRDIEDAYVKFSFEIDNGNAVITVEDNGIGIAEGSFEKIFTMFYRDTNAAHGDGLGLYIVKQNVEKLKGTISVKSKLGSGSTFTVVIPNG
jgi:PAS domain S-box-containing protein